MSDLLSEKIQNLLPDARIEPLALPESPDIYLWLLNQDYPQSGLSPEQVQALINKPLYWIFCWASGQVLARLLLDQPQWVRGKRVLDFGCGSGVVAIAAALAGAAEVIACDIDPDALAAASANAELNGACIKVTDDYYGIDGDIDLILVADVLYDNSNCPWLDRFVKRSPQVLVADSRVKNFDYPPFRQIDRFQSCTFPDLDESAEFRDVRIYLAG